MSEWIALEDGLPEYDVMCVFVGTWRTTIMYCEPEDKTGVCIGFKRAMTSSGPEFTFVGGEHSSYSSRVFNRPTMWLPLPKVVPLPDVKDCGSKSAPAEPSKKRGKLFGR